MQNLMMKLPPAVTRKAGRAALLASKNSPEILFATGVVGVVGTVVLACRATLKVSDVLDDANKELANAEFLVTHEAAEHYNVKTASRDIKVIKTKTALTIVKLYAPAVIVGGLSVAALTGGHRIQQNRIAGLTAAYAALEKGFEQYRKRVVAELGEEKDQEFRYGTRVEQTIEKTDKGVKTSEVVKLGDGPSPYYVFFDQFNKHWEPNDMHNRNFLQLQQTYANDRLNAYGHLFLNEVYDMLGFPRTPAGAVTGWVWKKHTKAGDGFVDFGIFDHGNKDIRDTHFGRDGYLLDFNVDGVIYDLLDENIT